MFEFQGHGRLLPVGHTSSVSDCRNDVPSTLLSWELAGRQTAYHQLSGAWYRTIELPLTNRPHSDCVRLRCVLVVTSARYCCCCIQRRDKMEQNFVMWSQSPVNAVVDCSSCVQLSPKRSRLYIISQLSDKTRRSKLDNAFVFCECDRRPFTAIVNILGSRLQPLWIRE